MAATLAALLAALDLDGAGPDRFVGRSPETGWTRIFGGLILAQALLACARTAGGRPVHSLHGYFLLPGDPGEPIGYAVERLRDGGSFTARRCTASQHGHPIFALMASFHAPEPGAFDHAARAPAAPPPEALAPIASLGGPPALRGFVRRHAAVELRPADRGSAAPDAARGPRTSREVWLRAAGPMPDDPALHSAVLAYATDIGLLDTAFLPHGRSVFDDDVQAASLDHSLWFHRPARVDGWLLYAEDSPSAAGGRGFARGAVFDRAGRLIASAAQEGLARARPRR